MFRYNYSSKSRWLEDWDIFLKICYVYLKRSGVCESLLCGPNVVSGSQCPSPIIYCRKLLTRWSLKNPDCCVLAKFSTSVLFNHVFLIIITIQLHPLHLLMVCGELKLPLHFPDSDYKAYKCCTNASFIHRYSCPSCSEWASVVLLLNCNVLGYS